jgi:protein-S-isoprenylcysteine O-methyltransferase Ste14
MATPAISPAPASSRLERLVQLALDIGERLFMVMIAVPFLSAFLRALPTHPNLVLLATSEMLSVALILTRRRGAVSVRAVSVVAGFAGTALPLLVRPGGALLAPTALCTVLMLGGLALAIFSKLYLNRSFGLVAANRGVKIGGPYRFVRHPMYLGYIVNQFGFLLISFSIVNLVIYAAAWTAQLVRVREEELVLNQDPAYRTLARRVTSRLIPGVY